MDETSIAKGHDYVTLFVDLERKKTIFVAQGKDNSTIKAFVADLAQHKGNANNIDGDSNMIRNFCLTKGFFC